MAEGEGGGGYSGSGGTHGGYGYGGVGTQGGFGGYGGGTYGGSGSGNFAGVPDNPDVGRDLSTPDGWSSVPSSYAEVFGGKLLGTDMFGNNKYGIGGFYDPSNFAGITYNFGPLDSRTTLQKAGDWTGGFLGSQLAGMLGKLIGGGLGSTVAGPLGGLIGSNLLSSFLSAKAKSEANSGKSPGTSGNIHGGNGQSLYQWFTDPPKGTTTTPNTNIPDINIDYITNATGTNDYLGSNVLGSQQSKTTGIDNLGSGTASQSL